MRDERTPACAWLVPRQMVVARCQVVMCYFFGGVAKLNRDWLWRAQPMSASGLAKTETNSKEQEHFVPTLKSCSCFLLRLFTSYCIIN